MKFFLALLSTALTFSYTLAQEIRFDIQFNGTSLILDKQYHLENTPITFSKIKFYISNVQFGVPPKLEKLNPTYHLIDLEKPNSLRIPVKKLKSPFASLAFNIGVDSVKSVSGVFGNDLDPTNGMYWAWQSGYINCKIEGSSPNCPARKNKFQFHLGGYAYPYNMLRTINMDIKKQDEQYVVTIDLARFIRLANISKIYQVMSPNKEGMQLSTLFASVFGNND